MSLKRHLRISKGSAYRCPFYPTIYANRQQQKQKKRKESDSLEKQCFKQIRHTLKERASVCTSKGSLTVETALALPVFVFAVVCMIYLFETMATQTVVKAALHTAGREIAQEASVSTLLLSERLEQKVVDAIGMEELGRSLIVKGSAGIDCSGTKRYGTTTVLDLSVKYQLKIPVLLFEIPTISKEEKIRIKGWTGYEGKGFGNQKEGIVYITETGMVYHKDSDCTYLDLSIRSVEKMAVQDIYECCSRCKWQEEGEMVYVTDTGERYHTTLSCSALKRTVYAVKKSEVYGRGGCSRCVK